MVPFAGPKRFQPVPIAIEALPKLDAVVISHDHYDHLDYPSIKRLARLNVPFITSLGVGMHLETWGIPAHRITELAWDESFELKPGLEFTAVPAHHFSGRSLWHRNHTLWSSMVIRTQDHQVFFSGDTGPTPEHARIGYKYGPFDLVMFEVGGCHPAWGDIHLGPENALKAFEQIGSGRFLPIHWAGFNLALHKWYEPADILFNSGHPGLMIPTIGEPVEPIQFEMTQPWWRDAVDYPGELTQDQIPIETTS
jgi:L-ascorbate metabolism protein UlaG (beta-lactamase superfamily)